MIKILNDFYNVKRFKELRAKALGSAVSSAVDFSFSLDSVVRSLILFLNIFINICLSHNITKFFVTYFRII